MERISTESNIKQGTDGGRSDDNREIISPKSDIVINCNQAIRYNARITNCFLCISVILKPSQMECP